MVKNTEQFREEKCILTNNLKKYKECEMYYTSEHLICYIFYVLTYLVHSRKIKQKTKPKQKHCLCDIIELILDLEMKYYDT